MASRAEELAKLLLPQKKVRFNTGPSYSYNSSSTSEGINLSGIFFNVILILFVLFIILLVVHFTIRPIFRFNFGDWGNLRLAFTNDGQLFWTNGVAPSNAEAKIKKLLPSGFTIQQDIIVDNNAILGKKRRVFVYRSFNPLQITSKEANPFYDDYPESNLLVYLAPQTNDLTVTAITSNNGINYAESAPTILNVPVRKVFRVTVVLLDRLLEVYLNGKLVGTKTFRYPLKMVNGKFFVTPEIFRSSVKIMNFQYWDRALTAREIINAPPTLPDIGKFELKSICS